MQLRICNQYTRDLRCFKSQLHILDLFRPLSLFPLFHPLKFETLKLFRSERRRCIRHLNVKSSGKKLIKDGSKSWPSFGRDATHATRWPSWTWCTSKRLEHAVKRSCRKSSYHWQVWSLKSIDIQLLSTLSISTLHLSSDVLVPIGAIQCCQSSYRSSPDLLRMIPMMDSAESSDDRWCLQPSRWLPKEGAPS